MSVVVPDDFTSLRAAINSFAEDEFAEVYIREGVHVQPRPPTGYTSQAQMRPRLRIYGDGIAKSIIRRTSTLGGNTDLEQLGTVAGVSIYDVTIEDVLFDGYYGANPPNSGGGCINFSKNMNTPHKGITLRRVGAINSRVGFGARNIIGSSWADPGIAVEACYSENVWTALTFLNSEYVKVLGNDFRNTGGDAIFAQGTYSYLPEGDNDGSCHHWIIEDNVAMNNGDTGIDITSFPITDTQYCGPHTDIMCRRNHLINAHIRVSHAEDVLIEAHLLEPGTGYKSYIGIDNGAGRVVNARIIGNDITSRRIHGIEYLGGRDGEIRGNTIRFSAPYSGQTGIRAAIRGTSVIEGNKIYNPAVDGINFANWGLAGDITQMDILNNLIIGFGRHGVYDDAKSQARVSVIGNRMYSEAADYAVYTGYTSNRWTIRENQLTTGAREGDEAVYAPQSTVELNQPYIHELFNKLSLDSVPVNVPWSVDGQEYVSGTILDVGAGKTVRLVLPRRLDL